MPASNTEPYPLLGRVKQPSDLKAFTLEELEALAAEVRRRIIETVSVNGGHLASPLGVVELTLALWYVFDADQDLVVWDVGHQSYAHKLLTGRHEAFDTLRRKGGLSGYPRRSESRYDAFGTGHSSTSISAALGMSVARAHSEAPGHVIAVIGDGSMTGGMAFEALNHAGQLKSNLIVVLNDNEMSISRNVGALAEYFTRLITARPYKRAREDVSSFVKRVLGPRFSETAQRLEKSVKGFITAGGLFQELGFNYVGPVDGHDLPALVGLFSNIKNMRGPILFHCATQKGRGYTDAENDPTKYHGVKPADLRQVDVEGEARPPERNGGAAAAHSFTEVFGAAMLEEAERDERVAAITAAMPSGTGLQHFQERFPERFFDVGICEQHAVTFAAGLATQGMRPVCAIYSTFLQRGYDQVIHDVCLQGLPIVFALDRAGLVGEDSPTHAGSLDLSFLRAVPNLRVGAPRDAADLRAMLRWALQQPGPVALRYPKALAPAIGPVEQRDVRRGELLKQGADAMLLAVGPCSGACLEASHLLEQEGLSVGVADARWVTPLDEALLERLSHLPLVTVEENACAGGFGSAVLEHLEQRGRLHEVLVRRVGLPDRFIEHARRTEQLVECGLDAAGIAAAVRALVGRHAHQPLR